MTKLILILSIILIIISPVVIIPLLFSMINYLPEIFSFISPNLGLEFFARITSVNYLTLYLSILSIMASVIIAVLLYRLEVEQKRKEKSRKLKQNKEMVFFFFDKAVVQAFKSQQELFWDSFDFVDINDNIFVKINSIKALMNNDKFMLLNKVMDKLKNIFDLDRNDGYPVVRDAVDDLMELITITEYSTYQYHLKNTQSVYDLFNDEAITLYNLLAPDNKQKIYRKDKIFDEDGNVILKRENEKTRIYDSDGTKLCDAKFDKKGIVEGKAKIFNYEGILIFDGEFVDNQRNGQGVEYLSNRIKTKEGTWKDGKLIDGIIYDVLLEDEDNLSLDEIHFLADNRHFFSETDNDLLVGHLKVKNEDYHIMENSLKNAAEVIDNYYNKF